MARPKKTETKPEEKPEVPAEPPKEEEKPEEEKPWVGGHTLDKEPIG